MGNGHSTTTTAATRMRLIRTDQLASTSSRRSDEPSGRTRSTHAPTPVNLATVDYLTAAVDEVVTATRAANPDAGPPPADRAEIYTWMRQHTAGADQTRQQVIAALELRQSLQHALRLGDDRDLKAIIRTAPCPRCRTWGRQWDARSQRVVCLNLRCVDDKGRPSSWTLQQVAEEHVAQTLQRCAT